MAWTFSDIPDQSGRVAVVTGANSGLGFWTAHALAGAGATVVLACRRKDAGDEAIEAIRAAHPDARVSLQLLDLASLDSVREAAEALRGAHPAISLLINNAGLMAIPRDETDDGFEMQLGVNHLGHFALTGLLLDRMQQAGPGSRVVNLSSMMHLPGRIDFGDLMGERRYGRWKAYCQSKLANILFSWELQQRLEAAGSPTIAVTAHPGYASTHLQTRIAEVAGSDALLKAINGFNRMFGQSARMGSMPTLRAATDPAVEGDDFYGPNVVIRGAPIKQPRAPQARNPETSRRLWEVSEDLTGVTYGL